MYNVYACPESHQEYNIYTRTHQKSNLLLCPTELDQAIFFESALVARYALGKSQSRNGEKVATSDRLASEFNPLCTKHA